MRNKALNDMLGYEKEQFGVLYRYCQEFVCSNSGSTCLIKAQNCDDDTSKFKRICICLGLLKKGFLEGCRPFIDLNGCHLKGMTWVLLTVVSVDPSNQMYPFAYAVVEKESYKLWKWFLEKLHKDLGIEKSGSWTFISDKKKGLEQVIQTLLSNAEHRHCNINIV